MDNSETPQEFVHNRAMLKSLCAALGAEPDIRIASFLSDNIKHCPSTEIQQNIHTILFPIYVHLQNAKLSTEMKHHLVELLRLVLAKARITQLKCLLNLYMALLALLYKKDQYNTLITEHEELKESTTRCLGELIKKSTSDVIESLYIGQYTPKLSGGAYACLKMAVNEKLGSLRLAALETLMILCQVHDDADPNDVVRRTQVADVVMFFFPGIAVSLHEVALGNCLQNHKITMMAVRAYGRIIALIMEDKKEDENISIESLALTHDKTDKSVDLFGNKLKLEGEAGIKKFIETTTRSQEWLDVVAEKLTKCMDFLLNLVRHPHFQVRNELLIAVNLILSRCSRNMTKHFMKLVEMLISLSEDEEKEIREAASRSLDDVNEKFSRNNGGRSIVEMLEENFYKLLTKLPRLVRRSDDSLQLLYLNHLIGHIRLLGKERLPFVMASVSHLRRLLLALVYVAELDYSHVSVFQDYRNNDIEDSTYHDVHSWKRVKFIRDTCSEEKFILVCKLLGELGNMPLLVDSILEMMSEMPQYRKELILILNSLATVGDAVMTNIHKQIIDVYTDSDNWYLPISVDEKVSLSDAQSNIVNCCLLIEGLGTIAMHLQEEYDKYLLKTLYLIIERAGSGNDCISQAGLKGLELIARSQKCENVAELMRNNIDYLSFHVSIKLPRVDRNPGVLDVFSVVMRYSTIDLLVYLKEIVDDALAQLSINYTDQKCYSLLKILHVFTVCIGKLTDDTVTPRNEKEIDQRHKSEIVIQSIVDYYNAKQESNNFEEEIVTSPESIENELTDGKELQFSTDDETQDEEKVPPPIHVKMIEEVMKCCLNFLPSKDVAKCLMAMQILDGGLHILKNWSEQLLPIVHQLWDPLVERFHSSNILVINRAWQLLYTLAHVSHDFIKSRTLKQILPSLARFLAESAKESYKKDPNSGYKFTQMYKLQKQTISQVGIVAKHLNLRESELWNILEITEAYLSSHQQLLQKYCVQLYLDIADCNADIVWVKCLNLWYKHVAKIPIGHKLYLRDLKILATTESDYYDNVQAILTSIEETTSDIR